MRAYDASLATWVMAFLAVTPLCGEWLGAQDAPPPTPAQEQPEVLSRGPVSLCCAGGCAMGHVGQVPQYPQHVQYPQGSPPVVPAVNVKLAPGQLDGLLAPIALYPDPLLSLMFPAATYPQGIVAAGQWFLATPNPTEYGISGVMTFIVSHHGKVYQKDFGADTLDTVRSMKAYNTDSSWTLVTDE